MIHEEGEFEHNTDTVGSQCSCFSVGMMWSVGLRSY